LGWQPHQVVQITQCFRNQLRLHRHCCDMAQHPSYPDYTSVPGQGLWQGISQYSYWLPGLNSHRMPLWSVVSKSVMATMLNSTWCPHPYLTFLLLLHQIMHVAYYLVQTVHMQYMLEAWGLSYPYWSFFTGIWRKVSNWNQGQSQQFLDSIH
jgi:hypothetical protein